MILADDGKFEPSNTGVENIHDIKLIEILRRNNDHGYSRDYDSDIMESLNDKQIATMFGYNSKSNNFIDQTNEFINLESPQMYNNFDEDLTPVFRNNILADNQIKKIKIMLNREIKM